MLIAAMSFGNVMSVMADTPSVKTVSSENVIIVRQSIFLKGSWGEYFGLKVAM